MGPLTGIKVLEFEAIGPVPFCGMMLADMGADVLLVDRTNDPGLGLERERWSDVMLRGRRSLTLDLKSARGIETARKLADKADALIEGFRPGVMERLGLGPDLLLASNPRLVYGRMTGWGQDGPMSPRAGHDIDYIALSGVLHAIGRKGEAPLPPLNLVGDFGGGGMLLAFGVVSALLEARNSGKGQVVDAAMSEGASLLTTMFWGMTAAKRWTETRGDNVLDTGAPWYDVYETSDRRHVAIGAIEPKFYAELLARLGLDSERLPAQHDRAGWPQLRQRFANIFHGKSRDEWCAIFEGSDACFAPVLSMEEAPDHPHNRARNVFVDVDGVRQPGPAPRFSRTPLVPPTPPEPPAAVDLRAVLAEWGIGTAEVETAQASGLLA